MTEGRKFPVRFGTVVNRLEECALARRWQWAPEVVGKRKRLGLRSPSGRLYWFQQWHRKVWVVARGDEQKSAKSE